MSRLMYKHPTLGWTPICGEDAVGVLKFKHPTDGWTPVCGLGTRRVWVPAQPVTAGGSSVYMIDMSEVEQTALSSGGTAVPDYCYVVPGISVPPNSLVTFVGAASGGVDGIGDAVLSAPFMRWRVVPSAIVASSFGDASIAEVPYGREVYNGAWLYTSLGSGSYYYYGPSSGAVVVHGVPEIDSTAMIVVTPLTLGDPFPLRYRVHTSGDPAVWRNNRAGAFELTTGDANTALTGTHTVEPSTVRDYPISYGPAPPYENPGFQMVVGYGLLATGAGSATFSSNWGSNLFAGSGPVSELSNAYPFAFRRTSGAATMQFSATGVWRVWAWWTWAYNWPGYWESREGEVVNPIKYKDIALGEWVPLCCEEEPGGVS